MDTINVISNNTSLSLIAIGYNNGFIKLIGNYKNKFRKVYHKMYSKRLISSKLS